MTIIFSAAAPSLIVMTVDSAVTLDCSGRREYITGRKAYLLPGVGCVATWGARDGNQIGRFLEKHEIISTNYSVERLASLVFKYLTEEYCPRDRNLDDVGYHVAGFDRNGRARLFHVFYGFDRPRTSEQKEQEYKICDHSPAIGTASFVYNGRNDLAEIMVHTLLEQIQRSVPTHFDLTKPEGLISFGDFITRFAGELTPEVGPPFLTHVISSQNETVRLMNDGFCPLDLTEVRNKLRELEGNN